MNSKVRKQDLEKLLFFDCETVRRNKELDINSKEYSLYAWKLRDKDTSELPKQDVVLKHYELSGALDPTFNKIVCITVGFIKDTTLYLKSLVGEQKDIIEEFYGILNSTGFVPCGHNIIQFDLPTIRLKGFESGVNLELLSDKHSDSQQKPWVLADNFMDTMEITKGTYYYNLSLDAMCMLAGINTPKDGISGADVSRVFYEVDGGLEIISDYCKKDVKAVAELFCALQGKKGFITDIVDRNETAEATPLIEEQPILKKLYTTEQFNNEVKDYLRGLKILKKDKAKVEEIVLAHYLKIVDVMAQNKKELVEINKQRTEEVKSFFKTLK
jgi:hypothetical protein